MDKREEAGAGGDQGRTEFGLQRGLADAADVQCIGIRSGITDTADDGDGEIEAVEGIGIVVEKPADLPFHITVRMLFCPRVNLASKASGAYDVNLFHSGASMGNSSEVGEKNSNRQYRYRVRKRLDLGSQYRSRSVAFRRGQYSKSCP